MKILAINPGKVYQPVQARDRWTYSIEYVRPSGAMMVGTGVDYASAPEAKQKMREEVYFLRRKHGVQTHE